MFRRIILLLVCLLIPLTLLALECKTCKKTIKKNYIEDSKGNAYCGRECVKAILPTCSQCKKKVSGSFMKHGSKYFCSKSCFQKILPECSLCENRVNSWASIKGRDFCTPCSKMNRCAECRYPFYKGIKLSDQRYICGGCNPKLIKDLADAKKHFMKAREIVKTITGKQTEVVPTMELLDYQSLQKRSKSNGMVRGYYHRKEIISTQKIKGKTVQTSELKSKTIYLLSHMTERNFSSTAVHEFVHDIIAKYFPKIKEGPEWAHEGLCQYVSYIYCKSMDWEEQTKDIQFNPNSVYGDGFRYLQKRFGDYKWSDIEDWINKTDFSKLPEKAPVKKL